MENHLGGFTPQREMGGWEKKKKNQTEDSSQSCATPLEWALPLGKHRRAPAGETQRLFYESEKFRCAGHVM